MTDESDGGPPVLVLEPRPASRRAWLADLGRHREVFAMLARKDFQTRYKRASLGVLWAVAVPVLQGVVLAVVFSRVLNMTDTAGYGAYVFSGVIAFSYFSSTLSTSVTAIVDGSGLTDKVWFPRALLVLVPGVANLVALAVSSLVLVIALPFLGSSIEPRVVLLLPGAALLVAFTVSLSLVVSALHVYFRDVKFLVQAALLVWLYLTPIVFTKDYLEGLASWVDFNPMTGIVTLFQMAALGVGDDWVRPVTVSVVVTLVLLVVGLEAQRRHDRLFVDLL